MTDLLTTIKEIQDLVRQKHLAGQHSQAEHTPKKYGKGGGDSAAGAVDDVNSRLGGMLTDVGGDPEQGKAWAQFDVAHEADVKRAVEAAGYSKGMSVGSVTAYSKGQFQGNVHVGSEMGVVVFGGKGVGRLEVINYPTLDAYDTKMAPSRKIEQARRRL